MEIILTVLILFAPIIISAIILIIGSCFFCIGVDKMKITMTAKGTPSATTREAKESMKKLLQIFCACLLVEFLTGVPIRLLSFIYSGSIYFGCIVAWLVYDQITPGQDNKEDSD